MTAVEVASDIGTLAVDTYVKLGFVFNPNGNVLTPYINGVAQSDTKTIPDATGTDFPADTETATLDWWRCAQLRTA